MRFICLLVVFSIALLPPFTTGASALGLTVTKPAFLTASPGEVGSRLFLVAGKGIKPFRKPATRQAPKPKAKAGPRTGSKGLRAKGKKFAKGMRNAVRAGARTTRRLAKLAAGKTRQAMQSARSTVRAALGAKKALPAKTGGQARTSNRNQKGSLANRSNAQEKKQAVREKVAAAKRTESSAKPSNGYGQRSTGSAASKVDRGWENAQSQKFGGNLRDHFRRAASGDGGGGSGGSSGGGGASPPPGPVLKPKGPTFRPGG